MSLRLSAALGLLLAGLAACSSNKSAEPEAAPLPKLPSSTVQFKEQWSASVGKGQAGEFLRLRPAVSASAAFVGSRDGIVLAVDRSNGKTLWRQKTGLPITGGVGAGYGMVLVGTSKGAVVAFNAADGKTLWQSKLGAAVLSAPAADAEVVVAQSADGKVYGLKRADGSQLWVHDTSVPVLSLRGSATPLLDRGTAYIGTAGGRLEAVAAASGMAAWELRVATNQGRSELERMVDIDGDLLMDGDQLFSVGFQSQLTAVDVSSARRLWQYEVSSFQDLAAGLGNVYVADSASTLLAVDAKSGKAVWKQEALAWRGLSGPVTLGNHLLVGDRSGWVHVLAQSDGRMLGRFRAEREPITALLVDQDTVYVLSADGDFSAWRLREQ